MAETQTHQAHYHDLRVLLQKHPRGWLLKIFKGQLSRPVHAEQIPDSDFEQAKSRAGVVVLTMLPVAPGEIMPILLFDEGDALFGKR